jgi:hypothetical protein
VISAGSNLACAVCDKWVVVLTASQRHSVKSAADIEPFGGVYAKHRLAEVGVQFVKDRLS